jgi:lysophospholipase
MELRKHSGGDPLVLKYATAGFFYEFIYRGVRFAQENASQYQLPCLFLHGTGDRIIPYQSSPDIFKKISSQDKKLKLYEGLYHELIQEPEQEEVLGDILSWLEKR